MIWHWWRRIQRHADIVFLWETIAERTQDRDGAEAAFRLHMEMDPAYDGMSEAEKQKFLKELP